MTDNKRQKRLYEIMCELQKKDSITEKKKSSDEKKEGVVVKYYGPYSDSSGERFYLPRKWELSPDAANGRCYKECDIDYSFKQGEMKGSDLIRNLHWLGQSGGLMTLMDESEDELNSDNDDSEQNDDNNELIGRGLVVNSKKR